MVTRIDRATLRGLMLASGVSSLTTESTKEEAVRAVVRIAHLSRGLLMWGDRARVYAATIDALDQNGITLGWIVEEVFDDPITQEVAYGREAFSEQGEPLHAAGGGLAARGAGGRGLVEERRGDTAGKLERPEGPVIGSLPPRNRVQTPEQPEPVGSTEAGRAGGESGSPAGGDSSEDWW